MRIQTETFSVFSSRDESSVCFSNGDEISGIFLTADDFLADFSNGEGSHRVCDTGVFLLDIFQ